MYDIESSIDRVIANHFPNPRASPDEIKRFEDRHQRLLDDELRAFYSRCNGASLFDRYDSSYEILPLEEIVRARTAVFGADADIYEY